jgi:hypothetical protein
VEGEPELWLWGHRVDLERGFGGLFPPLAALRKRLESNIHTFVTEPDIMLIVPGKLIVLIEAKVTSGNSLTNEQEAKPGEKPRTVHGLLEKYLPDASNLGAVLPARCVTPFYGQLFRNVVFAQAMARDAGIADANWAVVNLVSDTQWTKARQTREGRRAGGDMDASFEDPTVAIHSWLREEDRKRFRFSTWERLHATVIKGSSKLAAVDAYLKGKSANLRQAFDLS